MALLFAEIVSMSPGIQAELIALRDRVERLESDRRRTTRGHCNQREAATYLGRSREWLRQRERSGTGPARNSDGSYAFDALDAFKEQHIA